MNHSKSIMVHLVRGFVILFLIQFSLFSALSMIYQNRMVKDMDNSSSETMRQISASFVNEFVRLDSLLTSCQSDSSLNLAIFGNLPDTPFRDYASAAGEKLLLMRNALPYAKKLFAYVSSRNIVIRHTGGYIDKDIYAANTLGLTNDEAEQLWAAETGFYNIGGKSFYIKEIHNYGFIAVQIDMDLFGNIQSSLDAQYKFMVVNQRDEIIMKSQSFSMDDDLLGDILEKTSVVSDGVEYTLIRKRISGYSLTGILLRDATEYHMLQRYFFTIIFISGVLLALSFLSLLLLNIRIYVPLKKLAQHFGGSSENEIELVEEKMNDLLYELYVLSKKGSDTDHISGIALQYLLFGGRQLQSQDIEALRAKYPDYRIMALAMQSDSGEGGSLLLAEATRGLPEECKFDFVRFDAYKAALVVRESDADTVLEALSNIMTFYTQYNLYVGVIGGCSDIESIHDHYLLAEARLENCPICPAQANFSLCTQESETSAVASIGFEKLSKMVYAHDESAFMQFLETTFLDEAMTLGAVRELYTEIIVMLRSFPQLYSLSVSNCVLGEHLYHSKYMINLLCRYYTSLNTLMDSAPINSTCAEIMQYVNDHFSSALSLEIVAEAFNMNPVYLSNMFKKNTGVNFMSYVSKLRMDKAVLLLRENSSLKVYEIAEQIGIDNPATFIRQFKKYTGVTPEQYRRTQRIQQE